MQSEKFLAHLSRRLEWAIVIAHRPSSVHPSSSVRKLFTFSTSSPKTARWILMKLGRDEVLMVPYKCCCFFGQIRPGADPGRGQNRSRGGPLLQETSSADRKATATNRMDSNDLEACGKKVLLFLVPFRSQIFEAFLTSFWTSSFCLILMQFLWIFMW